MPPIIFSAIWVANFPFHVILSTFRMLILRDIKPIYKILLINKEKEKKKKKKDKTDKFNRPITFN